MPVVRLLAAVPSVIYGLIGILVLVPFVGNHLISEPRKKSVQYVIQLDGTGLIVGVLILTVMITPIMIAIIVDALSLGPARAGRRARPRSESTAGARCGPSAVRAARPAIVAAAVLAYGPRAGRGDHALDGLGLQRLRAQPARRRHLLLRAAAPACRDDRRRRRALSVQPSAQTVYAFAAVLLISSAFLSFAGYVARRSMRKYTLAAR